MDLSSQPITRFRALGTVELKGPEGTALQSVLARPKLLALLSYLAAAAPRGFQRRDAISALFWGELSQERARGALRQALYHLRQSLGEGVVVTRGDEEVGLDAERFWCDVAVFEEMLEAGAREEALEHYRGDLLHGFHVPRAPEFERWLDERRSELRERARVAAWEMARDAEAAGNAAEAARWGRQALKLAPFDEELARQVIELLGRLGDRSGAIREYEAFKTRLAEELELEPAAETRALIEAVRSRGEIEPAEVAVRDADASPGSAPAQPLVRGGARLFDTRAFRLGLLGGISLVVGLAIVWAFSTGDGPELDGGRVVVAVFENQTGDPDLDPLGRMVADWVTQGLDQIEVVDVVPSTTGLAPRPDLDDDTPSGPVEVRALAEATGAGIVVAGSYYRSGDAIEFQAQVVDARSGELLNAVAPVGGPLAAPGAVVDTLRQRVVGTIARVFDSRVSSPTAGSQPPSLEAYRAYLEGHRAFHSGPRMREALTFFSQAVALDSSFLDPRFYVVLAHANLGELQAADSNARLLVPFRPRMSDYQRNTLDWLLAWLGGDRMAALEAARARGGLDVGVEALRVNRPQEAVDVLSGATGLSEWYFHWLTLIEAYHVLGDYESELIEAQRAREVYPERMRMLDAEVRALASLGRIAEMEGRLQESLLLGPDFGMTAGRVIAGAAAELRAHGFQTESFATAELAIEWYLSRPAEEAATGDHRFELASTYYMSERWDEARWLFEELATNSPGHVNIMGFLGVLAARRGDAEEARRLSEELTGTAAPGDFGRDVYWQACIASQLGELERAVTLLREAYARGREVTVFLHRDMDLEPLRDYPPYRQFAEPKG